MLLGILSKFFKHYVHKLEQHYIHEGELLHLENLRTGLNKYNPTKMHREFRNIFISQCSIQMHAHVFILDLWRKHIFIHIDSILFNLAFLLKFTSQRARKFLRLALFCICPQHLSTCRHHDFL